jgi:asparagine synthetase B (glutamine-hydrolysing)
MNRLRELITKAVLDAALTEGKAGVLLSGGIDSSTVACIARGLPTFTGYYEGEPYDERPYANLARAKEHREILITPRDFVQFFDQMMHAIEPPFAGPGTFGQFMVARYVSRYVDVVLSGEGGDELFGGYARLHIVAGVPPPDGYEDYKVPEDYPDTVEEALEYDYERLPDLLRVDEQVTSYWNLEARAPMTDQRVVDYALSLHPRSRVGKVALKEAMRGVVPDAILARTDKRGFPVPFVQWAQQEPVRSFIFERIGYTPTPTEPWARQWWLDLCEASYVPA